MLAKEPGNKIAISGKASIYQNNAVTENQKEKDALNVKAVQLEAKADDWSNQALKIRRKNAEQDATGGGTNTGKD